MANLSKQLIQSLARAKFDTAKLPDGCNKAKMLEFIDAAASAIAAGMQQWQTTASMQGIIINSNIASGGQLVAPPISGLIKAHFPQGFDPLSGMVCAVLQEMLNTFTFECKIPGLPIFPAFAAFPGPMAPPMPNTPFPLIQMVSGGGKSLKKSTFLQFAQRFAPPNAPVGTPQVMDALGDGLEQAFTLWLTGSSVTKILGGGPVPTFAPPMIPVGPVVGGTGSMLPGGIV